MFGAGRAVRRWQVVAIEAALEKPSQNPWILDAAKNLSWLGTAIAASQDLTKPNYFYTFFLYIFQVKTHALSTFKPIHFSPLFPYFSIIKPMHFLNNLQAI